MQNKRPKIFGYVVAGTVGLSLFALFFGYWMFAVPLDSAAMAPGKLVVEGRSKTVQHFEGGIVKAINVREGDIVEQGQSLIELDGTRAKASLDLLMGQALGLNAQVDRLNSEYKLAAEVQWSEFLQSSSDPRRVDFMLEQQQLFNSRRRQYEERVAIINERIDKNRDSIKQLRQQIKSVGEQKRLFRSEIASVSKLVKQQLSSKSPLLALQRDLADVVERKTALESRIENLEYENRENSVQLEAQRSNYLSEVSEKLAVLRLQQSDLQQRLLAAQDVLERTHIKAPLAGQVVGLNVTTVGGIVGSGEPLLELVPQSGDYIVEARIDPVDVDVVLPGQLASVRFSAYSRRYMPSFDGELVTLSADRIEDPSVSEEPFYLAQIRLDAAEILQQGVKLQSGMPIEVTIKTEPRTMADYLLEPVMRSFDRAFTLN